MKVRVRLKQKFSQTKRSTNGFWCLQIEPDLGKFCVSVKCSRHWRKNCPGNLKQGSGPACLSRRFLSSCFSDSLPAGNKEPGISKNKRMQDLCVFTCTFLWILHIGFFVFFVLFFTFFSVPKSSGSCLCTEEGRSAQYTERLNGFQMISRQQDMWAKMFREP